MPKFNLVVMRHAQSTGNVNKDTYLHTPDFAVGLTPHGWKQAMDLGLFLANGEYRFPNGIFCSPMHRTRCTLAGLTRGFSPGNQAAMQRMFLEDTRLVEQDFGGLREKDDYFHFLTKNEAYGKFWWGNGRVEPQIEVVNRVKSFLTDLRLRATHSSSSNIKPTYYVVCHGVTMKALTMAALNLPYEVMARRTPENCETWAMELDSTRPFAVGSYDRIYPLNRKAGNLRKAIYAAPPNSDAQRRSSREHQRNIMSLSPDTN